MSKSTEFGLLSEEFSAISADDDACAEEDEAEAEGGQEPEPESEDLLADRPTSNTVLKERPLPGMPCCNDHDAICVLDPEYEAFLARLDHDQEPSDYAKNLIDAIKIDDDCTEMNSFTFDTGVGSEFAIQDALLEEDLRSLRMKEEKKWGGDSGLKNISSMFDVLDNSDEELSKNTSQVNPDPTFEPSYNLQRTQSRFPCGQNYPDYQDKNVKHVNSALASSDSRLAETSNTHATVDELERLIESDEDSSLKTDSFGLPSSPMLTPTLPDKSLEQTLPEVQLTDDVSYTLKINEFPKGNPKGFESLESLFNVFSRFEQDLEKGSFQGSVAPTCEQQAGSLLAETDSTEVIVTEEISKSRTGAGPPCFQNYAPKKTTRKVTPALPAKNARKCTSAIPKKAIKPRGSKAAAKSQNTGTPRLSTEKSKTSGKKKPPGSKADMMLSSNSLERYDIPLIVPQACVTAVSHRGWDNNEPQETDDASNTPAGRRGKPWKSSRSLLSARMKGTKVSNPATQKTCTDLGKSSGPLMTADLWATPGPQYTAGMRATTGSQAKQPAGGVRKSSLKSTKKLPKPSSHSTKLTGREESENLEKLDVLGMLTASHQSQITFSPEWCMSADGGGTSMLMECNDISTPKADEQWKKSTDAPKIPSEQNVIGISTISEPVYEIWSTQNRENMDEYHFSDGARIIGNTVDFQAVAPPTSVSVGPKNVNSVLKERSQGIGKCHPKILAQRQVAPILQKSRLKARSENYHVTPYDRYKREFGMLQKMREANQKLSGQSTKPKMIDPFNELAFLGEFPSCVSQPLNFPKVDQANKMNIQPLGVKRASLPSMGKIIDVPKGKSSVEMALQKSQGKPLNLTRLPGKHTGVGANIHDIEIVDLVPTSPKAEDCFDGRNGCYQLIAPKNINHENQDEKIIVGSLAPSFDSFLITDHQGPVVIEQFPEEDWHEGRIKDVLFEFAVPVPTETDSAIYMETPDVLEMNNVGGTGLVEEQNTQSGNGSMSFYYDSESKAEPSENAVATEDGPSSQMDVAAITNISGSTEANAMEPKASSSSEHTDSYFGDKGARFISKDSVATGAGAASVPARSRINATVQLICLDDEEQANLQKRKNPKQSMVSKEKQKKREGKKPSPAQTKARTRRGKKAPKINERFLVASAECVISEKVADSDLSETTDIYLACKSLKSNEHSQDSSGPHNLDTDMQGSAADFMIDEAAAVDFWAPSGMDLHLHDVAEQMGEFLCFKKREVALSHPAPNEAGGSPLISDTMEESFPAYDVNLSDAAVAQPIEIDSDIYDMPEVVFPNVDFALFPLMDDVDDVTKTEFP